MRRDKSTTGGKREREKKREIGERNNQAGEGEKKSSAKEISGLQNKVEEKSYSLEATNAILRKNQKREK